MISDEGHLNFVKTQNFKLKQTPLTKKELFVRTHEQKTIIFLTPLMAYRIIGLLLLASFLVKV